MPRSDKRNFNQIDKEELDQFVYEFALNLYHNKCLDEELRISKNKLRKKFFDFFNEKGILYDHNQDKKIGTILSDCNILYKSSSDLFCLKFSKLFEYERSVIDKYDNEQIRKTEKKTLLQQISDQKSDDYEIENNSVLEFLEFQSCVRTEKNNQFVSTNFACYICQQNLSPTDLQDHIPIHNDMTDFEWLKNNPSDLNANFEVFYQTCRNQYYLKFTMKTKKNNIKIRRIITIRSNSITTLKRNDEDNDILKSGLCSFVVDRHIFNIDTEQPVVVIYQMENINEIFIEHYFMRSKALSPINPHILPGYLSEAVLKRSELSKLKLQEYHPESKLKELCSKQNSKNYLMMYNNYINEYINNGKKLSCTNIAHILKFLVQLEDIETQNFYKKLKQNQATIKGSGRDFSVKVNLPKNIKLEEVVKPGDEVILKLSKKEPTRNAKEENVFHCVVNRIYDKNVCFESRKGKSNIISVHKKYDIEFIPNRLNFKYQYSAIEVIEKNSQLKSYLFPKVSISNTAGILSLDIINKSVEKNPEQKQAVLNIVNGVKDLPYIIVGPPGTGKTTTIVESILQVKLNHPKECRIIVTAGSNAACDEIGKRLVKLIESTPRIRHIKVLRLYAKSVEVRSENIDENLIAVSNLVYGDHFYPSLETIGLYHVVISTLSVLGRLTSSGMPTNFFSYCFIDECAASTEPEVLVAVSAVYHSKINIVVAGDPKQLGPILKSDTAAEFGLKFSFMERLLDTDCYQDTRDKSYNQRIQTRLVRNFRTHSDILQVSNNLFYSNSLIACAPKAITHWAANWFRLPKAGVPIIFHCANGYTKSDKLSTSLYNMREVNIVLDYVKKLMYFKKLEGRDIKEEDIGVISPYKKQNVIIREELDKRHWHNIATGAVETFQGQEKPIIIISTVRSMFSDKSGPGFLDNPKRLNVMLTRAQALLIIVGNLELLKGIENWKEAIDYFEIRKVVTNSNFLKVKSVVHEQNYLHCSNSLQNLSIANKTPNRRRNRNKRNRARSSQNLSTKNESARNGISEEKKVENWLTENRNFQKKILNVDKENKTSFKIDYDSDSIASDIPNPFNLDFLSSINFNNSKMHDTTGFGSNSAITDYTLYPANVEAVEKQTNSFIEKPINKIDFVESDSLPDKKLLHQFNSSSSNKIETGSNIKLNSFVISEVPLKAPVPLQTKKPKKNKSANCSLC
ncbi:putative helicase mov-10-B.1 isoform X2 [Condylostylus longicornis]|uniref:putative helicase mov-10-B.1 isoform X2 n=1 Tax=Condylostylus longicornis TaxID=2530218 RepID=UPI00244E0084|nr:putative helicase mov-10-B.1 isoform X2 [Condylostylus longicornis]